MSAARNLDQPDIRRARSRPNTINEASRRLDRHDLVSSAVPQEQRWGACAVLVVRRQPPSTMRAAQLVKFTAEQPADSTPQHSCGRGCQVGRRRVRHHTANWRRRVEPARPSAGDQIGRVTTCVARRHEERNVPTARGPGKHHSPLIEPSSRSVSGTDPGQRILRIDNLSRQREPVAASGPDIDADHRPTAFDLLEEWRTESPHFAAVTEEPCATMEVDDDWKGSSRRWADDCGFLPGRLRVHDIDHVEATAWCAPCSRGSYSGQRRMQRGCEATISRLKSPRPHGANDTQRPEAPGDVHPALLLAW